MGILVIKLVNLLCIERISLLIRSNYLFQTCLGSYPAMVPTSENGYIYTERLVYIDRLASLYMYICAEVQIY